jgi:hypothetical protein
MNIVWTSASLVGGRCFQVYSQAQTQKSQMQQEMSATLYDKMQDSQEGVVGVLLGGVGGRTGGGRGGATLYDKMQDSQEGVVRRGGAQGRHGFHSSTTAQLTQTPSRAQCVLLQPCPR